MRISKIILTILLSLSLVPSLVKADGLAIDISIDRSSFALHSEETQVAAINYEDGREKLLLAVKLSESRNSSVVWIVPVPADASDVEINILEEFPHFHGSDILMLAERERGEGKEAAVDIAWIVSMSQIYTFPYLLWQAALEFAYMGDGGGVEVYERVEKMGVVTEVVTAENADALYDYLRGKNITITLGSIPIIDDYIGKAYSFVVSWVKSIEDESKMPAIFVDFPTDEIYYPLKPTSVYGDAKIPVLIYVVGYAKPKLYSEIGSFTEYRYFTGGIDYSPSLKEFYGDAKPSKYTRIMIGQLMTPPVWKKGLDQTTYAPLPTPPSANFVDDLWIEKLERPPAPVEKAVLTLERIHFIRENMLYFIIGWLIVASLLAGGLTGYLMFRDFKNYALIGLANCFTIVGTIIATFLFAKEKKVRFIGSFSIIFLLIDFLVILPVVFSLLSILIL